MLQKVRGVLGMFLTQQVVVCSNRRSCPVWGPQDRSRHPNTKNARARCTRAQPPQVPPSIEHRNLTSIGKSSCSHEPYTSLHHSVRVAGHVILYSNEHDCPSASIFHMTSSLVIIVKKFGGKIMISLMRPGWSNTD